MKAIKSIENAASSHEATALTQKAHRDILLVDDEPQLLEMVGQLLEVKGFTVAIAGDAASAMSHLDKFNFGLLMLDINLAGESGLELMNRVKADHPTLRVLLYTGLSHDNEQICEMLTRGAACYVNKGQTSAELLFAVRELLELNFPAGTQAYQRV